MASLHNLDAVCVYLSCQQRPITFLCSGWKGEVSCEDVLLAGKALRQLSETGAFTMQQDACFMAMEMCQVAGNNWLDFILRNSPRLASKYSWLANDIAFCLSSRTSVSIPVLKGEWIEAL